MTIRQDTTTNGRLANTTEFRTLFTNAVSWAWNSESEFATSLAKASEYYAESRRDLRSVREEAMRMRERSENARLFKTIVISVAVGTACIAVYRLTFMKTPKS